MLVCLCNLLPTWCSSLLSACSCCADLSTDSESFSEKSSFPQTSALSPQQHLVPHKDLLTHPCACFPADSVDLLRFLQTLPIQLWGGAHSKRGCQSPTPFPSTVSSAPPPSFPITAGSGSSHSRVTGWPLALGTHDALCRAMLRHPESFLLPDGAGCSGEVMKVTYPGGKGRPGQGAVSSWGR